MFIMFSDEDARKNAHVEGGRNDAGQPEIGLAPLLILVGRRAL
ncbi:MAG TPA: hypothetical protein VER79_02425 [Candidatus Limnocylindrales bacterium]|nr:hypothetical protein [Candidatus Limnocylindrales bacterium]